MIKSIGNAREGFVGVKVDEHLQWRRARGRERRRGPSNSYWSKT